MDPNAKFFPGKTTFQNDYKILELPEIESHDKGGEFLPEKEITRKPYVGTFLPTLQPLNVPLKKLPFNLTWDPKPIIMTDPRKQVFYKLPPIQDRQKDRAIRERPRLNMAPAISMDDAPKNIREEMCTAMYTTEQQRLMNEARSRIEERLIPNTTYEANTYPVRNTYKFLEVERPNQPRKPEHLRTVKCDKVPFERDLYWPRGPKLSSILGRDPLENMVSENERKEIRDLVVKNELRTVYDKLPLNYGGHRPKLIGGKLNKTKIHDKLSV